MTATFCRACGQKLRIPDAGLHKKFRCPNCGQDLQNPRDQAGSQGKGLWAVLYSPAPGTTANITVLESVALGLGLLSIAVLCVPYLALVFSAIGLLLAVCGLWHSIVRRRVVLGYSLLAFLTCLTTVLLTALQVVLKYMFE
jgi:hypothetical protein